MLPAVRYNPAFGGYRCVVCGRAYARDHADYVCADCGVDGILDVVLDLDAVAAGEAGDASGAPAGGYPGGGPPGRMWDFAALLPLVPAAAHPAWDVGATVTFPAPRLARRLGVKSLHLKDDTGLPSASLKDRAAAVALAHAALLGRREVACASTGNAAASLAVLAARAGLTSHIFVPAAAPNAKLAQLQIHGADIVRVDGSYDQAFELSLGEITRHRWYSRNCAHNPLLVEGKKTAVLEMARDLSAGFHDFTCWPDAVFVPVGDGCIVSSVARGLLELHALGLTPRVPRVFGVQAEGAAPLANAWARCADPTSLGGREILAAVDPVVPATMADSISVGIPRNRVKAWRRVAATGGAFLSVSDAEIRRTIGRLARRAGLFAEPSGAAGVAGIEAALASGLIGADAQVAALVTGHGLKDPLAGLPDGANTPADAEKET